MSYILTTTPTTGAMDTCALCNCAANAADDALLRLTCCKEHCGTKTYHHNCIVSVVEKNCLVPQDRLRIQHIKKFRHNILKHMGCPCGCERGRIIETELVAQESNKDPSHPLPKPIKTPRRLQPKQLPKPNKTPIKKLPKPRPVAKPAAVPINILVRSVEIPLPPPPMEHNGHITPNPYAVRKYSPPCNNKTSSPTISSVICDEEMMEMVRMLLGE